MPMYSFQCSCGFADQEYGQMKDAITIGGTKACPRCGQNTYKRQADLAHTDLHEFDTPIHLHSVAATEWEHIREIQRKCPDVQISDDPNHPDFGVPIVKNRREKLQVLAATGFIEKN